MVSFSASGPKHCYRVGFVTQEILDLDKVKQLIEMKDMYVQLALKISEEPVAPDEEIKDPEAKAKSLSKRLYNVIFAYWKYMDEPMGDFEKYRTYVMENAIKSFKRKLPPKPPKEE